jgi:hypothetical protein
MNLVLIGLVFLFPVNARAASMSGYLGGGQYDTSQAMTVDKDGNIYMTGWTFTDDLGVTTDALQPDHSGFADAFVARFSPDGTTLEYLTYFGGSGNDNAYDIAVDGDGNVYIAGTTTSDDLMTVDPVQSSLNGDSDAFVAKINASGVLVFSSYFGGSGNDTATALHVDDAGRIYFAGNTTSTDMLTVANPFDSSCGSDGLCDAADPLDIATRQVDGYVGALTRDTQGFYVPEYASYIGGNGFDYIHDIAVDSAGVIYMTGETNAGDFPYKNAFQSTIADGIAGAYDAFMIAVDPQVTDDNGLVYSSYIGGDGNDAGNAIAVASDGIVYVAGDSSSSNFPVTNAAMQADYGGGDADVFVAQFDITQTSTASLKYASYLGGSNEDLSADLVVDPAGDIYIAGMTDSLDLSLNGTVQFPYDSDIDGFVVKISGQAKSIVYSSYFGSYDIDLVFGMSVNSQGDIYLTGETESDDLATAGAWQPDYAGNTDALLALLDPAQAANKSDPGGSGGGGDSGGGGAMGHWLMALLLAVFLRRFRYRSRWVYSL